MAAVAIPTALTALFTALEDGSAGLLDDAFSEGTSGGATYTKMAGYDKDALTAEVAAIVRNQFALVVAAYAAAAMPDYTVASFNVGWGNAGGHVACGHAVQNGRVFLRGTATGGTGSIMTLPADARPSANVVFVVPANGALGIVTIDSAGDVTLTSGSGTNVSLDGISFAL